MRLCMQMGFDRNQFGQDRGGMTSALQSQLLVCQAVARRGLFQESPIFLVLFVHPRGRMAGFLVKPERLPKSSVLAVP